MPFESFYAAASSLFFTLLGFWWVVVQLKRNEWINNPARRRMAYIISLHFFVPGVMCVASLLSEEVTIVWNITFALAGLLGVVATASLAVLPPNTEVRSPLTRVGHIIALVAYALITLIALFPSVVGAVGLNVRPLLVEGALLVLIALLGINMAWFLFMEPDRD